MKPKEKHNNKPGKYSFDKFGNLIPFTDCKSSQIVKNKFNKENPEKNKIKKENPEIDINFKFPIKNLLKFSIYGGGLLPYGESIAMFELGPYGGLDIKLKNYAISVIGSRNENKTIQNEIDINETLTSIGIYTGYIINLGNIYLKPSVGLLNRTKKIEENKILTEEISGSDLAFKAEAGIYLDKISVFSGASYSTTLVGLDYFNETALFISIGLKYNF